MMNQIKTTDQVTKLEYAANSGDAKASLLLGNHFHALGDMDVAFHWYLLASQQEQVNPIVFFYLGYSYQYGEGTKSDMTEAYLMYKKAAEADVPQALYSLAYFYQNGLIVSRDELTAFSYMKQATAKIDLLYMEQYDCRKETNQLRNHMAVLKEKNSSLEESNQKLLVKQGKMFQKIEDLQNYFSNQKEMYEKCIDQYQQQTKERNKTISKQEEKIVFLQNGMQTLLEQMEKTERRMRTLEKNIAEKEQQICSQRDHNYYLRSLLEEAKLNADRNKEKIADLNQQISLLKTQRSLLYKVMEKK